MGLGSAMRPPASVHVFSKWMRSWCVRAAKQLVKGGEGTGGFPAAPSRVRTVSVSARKMMGAVGEQASLGLEDASLVKPGSLIAGRYACVGGADGSAEETLVVRNPATSAALQTLHSASRRDAVRAIESAHAAFLQWRHSAPSERYDLLQRWAAQIDGHEKDLARLLTLENGKPYAEALGEIRYGNAYVKWFAEEAVRMYGDHTMNTRDSRGLVIRQPVGVAAAITPWNFPCAMVTRKVAPAIAAGCAVVLKPAELTPLTALALAELAKRAGAPDGLFNVLVAASPKAVGEELCTNPLVRKVSFTGSTPVGKQLLSWCSSTVKRTSMELGGLAAFIVMDDACIDTAVAALMQNKFRNAGQTCVCANRIYVQQGVYDEFVHKVAEKVKALVVGDGLVETSSIGPLINAAAVAKANDHVRDAEAKGAKIVARAPFNAPAELASGHFFAPCVLRDATDEMKVSFEETFGPVAPIFAFRTEEEVLARANASPFGLSSYLFTRDIGRITRLSEGLECGIVGVNQGAISDARMPFGGVKESGMGKEGGRYGLEDYTIRKYILIGALNDPPAVCR
ncbi:Succinate-semialdehyde dehydrogenase NADP(+) GabD [Porphyridium purpureum]|uniref:Succinate-semialdehyde dehydrogenase, mitochondrial n=1 Tax=Porphyridium purpureum TaxID=35688 RepID=A0A5J4Z0M9_PORPP|nr:Succinate-semialdehyde dehydrogenase NADP(+) GabD [Porphyridium purpureum]|eukprot:POR8135..scf208_2